jgi:hypothetical protein
MITMHEEYFPFLNTSYSTHESAYQLFKSIYNLQENVTDHGMTLYPSSVNLTNDYDPDRVWLSTLLYPFDRNDLQVYANSFFVDLMQKIDQTVNLYDSKSVQVFILYLLYVSPLEFLHKSTTCSNLFMIYPNELREILFDSSANKEAFKVFHYIKNSIIEAIKEAQWMDDQTKKEALEKALRMGSLFQMPDFQFPTKKMESCSRKEFISNYLQRKNAVEYIIWEFHSSNRVKWRLQEHFYFVYDTETPSYSQINGVYDQVSNVFKVFYGMLGSPFLDVNAPYAVKFGGLGTIIGHEISQ